MRENFLNLFDKYIKNLTYKRKYFLILGLFLIFYLMLSAYIYSETISEDLSNSLIRLHVIANSDSEKDQDIKYIVRDSVLKYMQEQSSSIGTTDEAKKFVLGNMNEIRNIADSVLASHGYNYKANVYFGKFDFPTKVYGDVTLPAGEYQSLRIVLGTGSGKNWWCVMFPPLCFVDASTGILPEESKSTLKNVLNEEEYQLALSNSKGSTADIKIKFKIVEFLQGSRTKIAKNKTQ